MQTEQGKEENNDHAVKRLSKQDILEGAKRRELIYVEGLDRNVLIRPLTFGELAKLSSMAGVPLSPDGTPDVSKMDNKEVLQKHFDFIKQVVSLGIVNEGDPFTPDEIDKLPGGVPVTLATMILEISGWASPEVAKKKDEI